MGFLLSKVFDSLLSKKKDVRLLMLGLDGAGKTTVLYKLKTNETIHTIPTIGFNCEAIDYKGLAINVWDVGGQTKIRPLWKHYYQNTDGIIYVVDSNDKERIEECLEELEKLLQEEELVNSILLVFANKQDVKDSFSPNEVAESLNLSKLKNRKWLVQGSCATSGQGIREGLDWMAKELLKKH
jgi:ADP-ribosylation factor 1/2